MRLDVNFKENNKSFNGSFGELKVVNGKSAYEIAVEEGATFVRVGTSIFGRRM